MLVFFRWRERDVNRCYEGAVKRGRCYFGEGGGDLNRVVGVRNDVFLEIL